MTWLQLALLFMKVVNGIISVIDKEKMLTAGEARNAVKAMEAVHGEVEKARWAIAAIRGNPEWHKRLQELADRDR